MVIKQVGGFVIGMFVHWEVTFVVLAGIMICLVLATTMF